MESSNDFGLKIMSIPQTATEWQYLGWLLSTRSNVSEKIPELYTVLLCLGGREKEVARLGLHCFLKDTLGPTRDADVLI